MSSKEWDKTMKLEGIFSSKKKESPLYNANKAYLRYCSSDFYAGNVGGLGKKGKAEDLFGYKFRG